MGFNYAVEKKKFERLWKKLRVEYAAAGMSDADIQKMYDFDWAIFRQERIYHLHTQEFRMSMFDDLSPEQEDKSALMKKFLEAVSCCDDYGTGSQYAWIEEINDSRISARLKELPPKDLDLLTRYAIGGYSQAELARQYGISQKNIHKKLQRIKKYLQKGV